MVGSVVVKQLAGKLASGGARAWASCARVRRDAPRPSTFANNTAVDYIESIRYGLSYFHRSYCHSHLVSNDVC
eukprot:SAG22_NODE_104_length_20159_cov_5.877517_9_plen_73_part_00